MSNMKDYITCIIVVAFALVLSIMVSPYKVINNQIPIFVLFTIICFLIHFFIFIPSYIYKTEKFYDITGTLAYLVIFVLTYLFTTQIHQSHLQLRSGCILLFITVWALRLGIFLFIRVLKAGEDKRFREVKVSFSKYLVYFTVSGLWVLLTTLNALLIIIKNEPGIDILFIVGTCFWFLGFVFEVVSDEQKRRFRKQLENKDKFISSGLWSLSRHPNYFGDILQWVSIAMISISVLNGLEFLTLISPLFVIILLTKVSGNNILEKNADEKWLLDESYIQYKNNTPVLIPFIKVGENE